MARIDTDETQTKNRNYILMIGTDIADDEGPVSPEEIARVLAAMRQMKPLEIPDDIASDLDAWERRPTRRGIDHADDGIGDALRLCQALDVWKLWLVDTAAAFEYGRLAFELKTIGRPVGQNDIMRAAVSSACERGHEEGNFRPPASACVEFHQR